MTTDPDATSVHADPSPAKNPTCKTAVFGPWIVEIHGTSGEYWAQIRDEGVRVFATGATMAEIEHSIIHGICVHSIDQPPEVDGALMYQLAQAILSGMRDADGQPV